MGTRLKYNGPAILSKGYRPFFLLAPIWAMLSLFLWVLLFAGIITLPTDFISSDWHIHEMLFGYTSAVIAGFLLTAVPNWTGRFPISGWRLLILTLLWVAGRIVIFFSSNIDPIIVLLVDISFLLALSLVIAREIIAGKNWRNLRVLALLAILTLSNFYFHLEVMINGYADYSIRLGLSIILLIIMLIGGRIIPSFTRNWLVRFNQYDLPAPFSRFDVFSMIISIIALFAWVFLSQTILVGILFLFAGVINLIRLIRWAGVNTIKEPMIFILHIGFLFIPLGFFSMSFAAIFPNILSEIAAVHLWTAGAIGMMTMAMMSRVSLAHGGQRPEADRFINIIYIALFLSVILRFAVDIAPDYSLLINISGFLWILAYFLFIIRYWKVLTKN